MRKSKVEIEAIRYRQEEWARSYDPVVIEEPLEIVVDGHPYYVTMRLPGEETYLALGYCFSEGIIDSIDDVAILHYCVEEESNRVELTLDPGRKTAKGTTVKEKRAIAYSSCGICGKDIVEMFSTDLKPRGDSFTVSVSDIEGMITKLEERQQVFTETGGAHAVAVFDRQSVLLAFAEDIGRHNALDKALGRVILENKMKDVVVVITTSRLSFEMVQKSGRSNAEILVGMSSATTLGIQLAKSINLTLVASARKGSGYIDTGTKRIVLEEK